MPHPKFISRRFSVALLLLGVLCVVLNWLAAGRIGIRPVRAALLCVNPAGTGGCFTTIGAAVAAAAAGDTINVAAGTYNEQVNLNKPGLFLRGAKATTAACARLSNENQTVNEAVITYPSTDPGATVQINADNVTLDGFIIQGANGAGITTGATFSGQRVLNNIIRNNVIGLFLNSNGSNPVLVQGNNFLNNNRAGSGSGTGINSDSNLNNAVLRQNCFSGHPTASILILGTTERNADKFSGITIADNSAQGERFVSLAFTKNITISGNRVADAPATPGVAMALDSGNANITLEGNTITNALAAAQNTAPAILVRNRFQAISSDITVRCNRLIGNLGGGLVVQDGAYNGTVLAENNWWGCNTGPGNAACDAATGNVDVNPWLVMSLTVPATSIRDAPTPLSVSLTRNSAGGLAPCGGVPDGTPVSFLSSCGTPNPATATTVKGTGQSNLAPNSLGTCNVTATVDKQSLNSSLTVMDGPAVTVAPLTPDCIGPGTNLSVNVRFTNTGATTQNLTLAINTPSPLSAVPGLGCSIMPNGLGSCVVAPDGMTVNYTGTLPAGQQIAISFLLLVGNNVFTNDAPGFTTTSNLGGVSKSVTNNVRITCELVGPGTPLNTAQAGGAQQPGSVLIYTLYTSSASTTNSQNTRLSMTNTSTTSAAMVHLFFVARDNCQVSDAFVCLTANQTTSFLASDVDPGTTGYLIAVAINAQTGCPVQFNHLIGDEYVKFTTGHQANLGAEAFARLSNLPADCDSTRPTTDLRFNGVDYGRLPAVVALDNVPSRADGNSTLWFIDRLDGNLATSSFTSATLTGVLYDDTEAPYAIGNYGMACQLTGQILPLGFSGQRFETVVPPGHTGWLKLFFIGAQQPKGLLGAQLNFNPNTRSISTAFNQGHLLHKLTMSDNTVLTIPVAPPTC